MDVKASNKYRLHGRRYVIFWNAQLTLLEQPVSAFPQIPRSAYVGTLRAHTGVVGLEESSDMPYSSHDLSYEFLSNGVSRLESRHTGDPNKSYFILHCQSCKTPDPKYGQAAEARHAVSHLASASDRPARLYAAVEFPAAKLATVRCVTFSRRRHLTSQLSHRHGRPSAMPPATAQAFPTVVVAQRNLVRRALDYLWCGIRRSGPETTPPPNISAVVPKIDQGERG